MSSIPLPLKPKARRRAIGGVTAGWGRSQWGRGGYWPPQTEFAAMRLWISEAVEIIVLI